MKPTKIARWSLSCFLSLIATGPARSATLYVWQMSRYPAAPYSTWGSAAHTIQVALDAAVDGDTVVVGEGEYVLSEQINVSKAVNLQSVVGAGQTILNAEFRNTCLAVSNTNAIVTGFTVTGGHPNGIYVVGGTVQNCV